MRVLSIWVVVWVFVVAAVALASDGVVKDDLTVFSGKSVKSKELVALKKGAEITILVSQGDWTRIKTGSGKVGWVFSSAVEAKASEGSDTDDLDLSGVEVASIEGETGGAIRGRPGRAPGVRLVVVVVSAPWGHVEAQQLADAVAKIPDTEVIATIVRQGGWVSAGPTGPIGGGPAGRALARALGGDTIFAVASTRGKKGQRVRYEVVDGRAAKVVADGSESMAAGLPKAFEKIAAKAAPGLAVKKK